MVSILPSLRSAMLSRSCITNEVVKHHFQASIISTAAMERFRLSTPHDMSNLFELKMTAVLNLKLTYFQ